MPRTTAAVVAVSETRRGAEADGLDGGDERRERRVRVRVDARDAARQIHLGASHAADALQGLLYRANAVEAGHPAEADRRSAHDQAFLGAVLSALRQALYIDASSPSLLVSYCR